MIVGCSECLIRVTSMCYHGTHWYCKARSEFVGECLMRMDDIGFGDYCFHRLRTDFRRFVLGREWRLWKGSNVERNMKGNVAWSL